MSATPLLSAEPKSCSRLSRRTVALLEVSEGTAAGMLAAMPTIKYAYNLPAAGGEGASGGEQSRVESGSVYILPPVRYPERGGRLFVKLGGGPNEAAHMGILDFLMQWTWTDTGEDPGISWLELFIWFKSQWS